MIYLTLAELLHVGERTLGAEVPVRDRGLLQSALAHPPATAFGTDAYPALEEKAAALLHSLARDHALVDGNKRLALAATLAFLGILVSTEAAEVPRQLIDQLADSGVLVLSMAGQMLLVRRRGTRF